MAVAAVHAVWLRTRRASYSLSFPLLRGPCGAYSLRLDIPSEVTESYNAPPSSLPSSERDAIGFGLRPNGHGSPEEILVGRSYRVWWGLDFRSAVTARIERRGLVRIAPRVAGRLRKAISASSSIVVVKGQSSIRCKALASSSPQRGQRAD